MDGKIEVAALRMKKDWQKFEKGGQWPQMVKVSNKCSVLESLLSNIFINDLDERIKCTLTQ